MATVAAAELGTSTVQPLAGTRRNSSLYKVCTGIGLITVLGMLASLVVLFKASESHMIPLSSYLARDYGMSQHPGNSSGVSFSSHRSQAFPNGSNVHRTGAST